VRRRLPAAVQAAVLTGVTAAVVLPATQASAAPTAQTCYTAAPVTGSAGPSFTNRTGLLPADALLGRYGHTAGWGDANGDGLMDLFLGTYHAYPPLMANPDWTDPAHDYAPDQILINTGSGFRVGQTFADIPGWTSGVVFTDLDRDGDDDLVLSRYAEKAYDRAPAGNTVLLRNDGGTFVRTSVLPAGPGGRLGGRSIGVLDYDGDGWLDLFLTQDRYSGASSRLLRNPHSLSAPWTDVTAAARLPLNIEGFSATTTDLTGDRRPDIFVAGSDRLFVWRSGNTFAEGTANVPRGPRPVNISADGTVNDFYTGSTSADVNGDGRLDLLLGAHFISVETHNNAVPPVRLLLNRGNTTAGLPRFADVTAAAGLPTAVRSKSATVHVQDFDNDGILDIMAGVSRGTSLSALVPTVFRGTGQKTSTGTPIFTRPASIAAVNGPTTPNARMAWVAAPWADLDRDGRLDVFGDFFFNHAGVRLFTGAASTRSWLAVALDSREFTAPGARVEVYTAGNLGVAGQLIGRRTIAATEGYVSAVPLEARFGFGSRTAPTVDVRIVPPPGSPTGQTDLPGVGVNRLVLVGSTPGTPC
jgi:enediyne biosynthesis protein E4